jgi:hypothetical protein
MPIDRMCTTAVREIVVALRTGARNANEQMLPCPNGGSYSSRSWKAVKKLRRTAVHERAARDDVSESGAKLWVMLEDSFWFENDLTQLACKIEEVVAELERVASSTNESPIGN